MTPRMRRTRPWTPSPNRRAGLTLIELMVALVVLGILLSMTVPRVSRITMRSRVDEAAGIVAGDLSQTISLAARRGRPVTISLEGSNRYVVKDRATSPADTVRLRRNLALGSDAGVSVVSFSPASVTVFPNGTVSAAFTVTLTTNGYTRTVTMSQAGQVRNSSP